MATRIRQPPSCPPSGRRRDGCPTHVVSCAQPRARLRSESEASHSAAPHAPGTKASARPRCHRRRRPRTRCVHFDARPVHVLGIAGFLVEVGERPRRCRVRRSRVDETISGLAVVHCGYAQPPASVVPALRAPTSRTPHTPFGQSHRSCRITCTDPRPSGASWSPPQTPRKRRPWAF